MGNFTERKRRLNRIALDVYKIFESNGLSYWEAERVIEETSNMIKNYSRIMLPDHDNSQAHQEHD